MFVVSFVFVQGDKERELLEKNYDLQNQISILRSRLNAQNKMNRHNIKNGKKKTGQHEQSSSKSNTISSGSTDILRQ